MYARATGQATASADLRSGKLRAGAEGEVFVGAQARGSASYEGIVCFCFVFFCSSVRPQKESTAALLRAEACKLAQALEDPSVPKWTSRKEPSELEERLMHLQESELKGRSRPMWEEWAEQRQEVLEQE